LLRQREFFYGKSWDAVTESFKKIQGAADGAIDQWINILDEVAKADEVPGRFLPSLQDFLKTEAIEVSSLVNAWSKACDVPIEFQPRGSVQVRVALRYVNSFRNRFAHVPFPHDPLEDISKALESATEQLFGVLPQPVSHEKDGISSPLTGALRIGQCFLHGSLLESLPWAEPSVDLRLVFPCQKRGEFEVWPADVLVHIDSMMRPHILTRIKGLDVCEYTRYRAEANAVLVLPDAGISTYLPEPDKGSYVTKSPSTSEEHPEETPRLGTADALEAIRNDDFDTGIKFFSQMVRDRPEYHVAWLRLGHARREKAVRLATSDKSSAIEMLMQASDDLTIASEHIDPSYKALAHYERSKAIHRIAQLRGADEDMRNSARQEAVEACKLSNERKYQTWLDYLDAYPRWITKPEA
jgi:hypothetical protein